MNFRTKLAALLGASLLGSINAGAADDIWLGVKAGTLGFGIEGAWRPIPLLDVRLGTNFFNYSENGSQAGINYDATLRLRSFSATANLLFPLSPFRISAGALSNSNEVRMVSVDNSSFDIGGTNYSSQEVGTLTGTASFNRFSPYLGAGFDFSLFDKIGLNLDFGVLWQGSPEVSLFADGQLANDPAFQSNLEAERAELEDDFSSLKAYPVISLGISYGF
jgi:hypothetical protein